MRRILIIKPSSMGDIIHGLLVAEAIRAQLPEVKIDWVVRQEFSRLVKASFAVERCFIFERKAGVGAFVGLLRELRTESYDAVLDMQGLARSGIMALAARTPRRIGRFDAREGAKWLCREHIAKPAGEPPWHAVEILAGFLPALGLERKVRPGLCFKQSDGADDLLPPLPEGKMRVIVFPESRRTEKNWSGYDELTAELIGLDPVGQVVWCGHLPCEPRRAMPETAFVNLTAQTGVDALPALLESAHCVVSNDSGPMHLAAALGRPLVALFGPTSPRQFGPYPR
ncbi:MAG TPA: glycosyltransferase family 9 protein, partial [Opitutales bacterium]|nr:glycosyltransferase family 9 protein [Opitutales bacterium]